MLLHEVINNGKEDNTAIIYKGKNVTYKEFTRNVELFKNYFYLNGIRKGDRVGLLYKNSAEFIYSYMAVVSLGAIIVPFNIMLTDNEINYMIKNAGIKHVVSMKDITTKDDVKKIIMPEVLDEIFFPINLVEIPEIDMSEDDACTIIYTSGTTGHPKGAVLSHKNLIENAKSVCELTSMTEADCSLAVLPMFHSFSWTTMVTSLFLGGAKVCIMEMFVPGEALRVIQEYKVTYLCGVPSMYKFYLEAGTKEIFKSVRLFVCGGAGIPKGLQELFRAKFGKEIMEGYGLSEAAPLVCFNPINKSKEGSVGLAVPRVQVKIVDKNNVEMKDGTVGELIVHGTNVMKGYFGMEEETNKTVVNGWLHTGDLAYKDKDGYVYIVDRIKDMIIVSGLNVYPSEIEKEIVKHPNIEEVAVIGLPDETRGEIVCAVVKTKEGVKLTKKDIINFMKPNVATYKLPRLVYTVDILPKNMLGKIMKKDIKEKFINERKTAHERCCNVL